MKVEVVETPESDIEKLHRDIRILVEATDKYVNVQKPVSEVYESDLLYHYQGRLWTVLDRTHEEDILLFVEQVLTQCMVNYIYAGFKPNCTSPLTNLHRNMESEAQSLVFRDLTRVLYDSGFDVMIVNP